MRLKIPATLLVFLVLLAGGAAAAQKPLLMEGKKSLYQRVLSVPDAQLYEIPVPSADASAIVPFSVLYVYDKSDEWLQVGYDSFGGTAGWVRRDQAIEWNQALTVSFKDPQDIQRVMMFGDKDDLQRMVDDYDTTAYQALYESVVAEQAPADSP